MIDTSAAYEELKSINSIFPFLKFTLFKGQRKRNSMCYKWNTMNIKRKSNISLHITANTAGTLRKMTRFLRLQAVWPTEGTHTHTHTLDVPAVILRDFGGFISLVRHSSGLLFFPLGCWLSFPSRWHFSRYCGMRGMWRRRILSWRFGISLNLSVPSRPLFLMSRSRLFTYHMIRSSIW